MAPLHHVFEALLRDDEALRLFYFFLQPPKNLIPPRLNIFAASSDGRVNHAQVMIKVEQGVSYFLDFIKRTSLVELDQDFLVKLDHQLAVLFEKVWFLLRSSVDLSLLNELRELEEIIFLDQFFVVGVQYHLSAHSSKQNLRIFPPPTRIAKVWLFKGLVCQKLHVHGKALRA